MVYVVVKSIDAISIVTLVTNIDEATNTMESAAKEYVCDIIGKNNYVDTLSGEYANKAPIDCPAGYVLKREEINSGDSALYKIAIYLNEKISGYLQYYNVVKTIGFFAVYEYNDRKNPTTKAIHTRAPAPLATSETSRKYNSVCEQLKLSFGSGIKLKPINNEQQLTTSAVSANVYDVLEQEIVDGLGNDLD